MRGGRFCCSTSSEHCLLTLLSPSHSACPWANCLFFTGSVDPSRSHQLLSVVISISCSLRNNVLSFWKKGAISKPLTLGKISSPWWQVKTRWHATDSTKYKITYTVFSVTEIIDMFLSMLPALQIRTKQAQAHDRWSVMRQMLPDKPAVATH